MHFFPQMTLADLRAYDVLSLLFSKKPDLREQAPLLTAHCDDMEKMEEINDWLKKRPDTEF